MQGSTFSSCISFRKTVRALSLLLPLLGTGNVLNMVRAMLGKHKWEFAMWSFSAHFVSFFQGLLVALMFCFLNREVSSELTIRFPIFLFLWVSLSLAFLYLGRFTILSIVKAVLKYI